MTIAFPGFASPFNIDALLATIAVTSVVGLAQVSVLAIGQFNLALPAIGAFTGMVLGWLLQIGGLPGRSRCCSRSPSPPFSASSRACSSPASGSTRSSSRSASPAPITG